MQARHWLSLYGINVVGILLLELVVAWWMGDFSLMGKGAFIAVPAAAAFTLRESWGWGGSADKPSWRKRYLQTLALWSVLFVVLAFVLASVGKG